MSDEPEVANDPQSVTMHYIKSNLFRVIHADGAIGSLTPQGSIHMSVYSERPAIPQLSLHQLVDGVLSEPSATEGKIGFVRELEASLMLSPKVARDFARWLNDRADEMDSLTAENGK